MGEGTAFSAWSPSVVPPSPAGKGARGLGLLLVLFLLLALPTAASADYPGEISGRLVDRTPGAAAPAGVEVRLTVIQGGTVLGEKRTQTAPDGSFSFISLLPENGLTYRVTTVYAGAAYASDPVTLSETSPHAIVALPVYEATGTDPGLSGDLALVVLRGVDAARQEVQVAEFVRLVNPSDRTFVPGSGGTTGPTSFVRFALPNALRAFQPTGGLDPSLLAQSDLGFASFAAVPPGEHEVSYEYTYSYAGARSLEKSLPYGARQLYVLSTEDGPTVSSPALTPGAPFTLQGKQYRMWSAQSLAPGTRLTIGLQGLPARPLPTAAVELLVSPIVLPPVLGLILLAGLVWQLRRPRLGVPSREEAADA